MYFEINVALRGKHYFATHKRSFQWEDDARKAIKDFKKRFPESEGFSVTCSKHHDHSTTFDPYQEPNKD